MFLGGACLLTYREGIFVFFTVSVLKEDCRLYEKLSWTLGYKTQWWGTFRQTPLSLIIWLSMTPIRNFWKLHSFLKETMHSHVSHSPCISSSATCTTIVDSEQPETSSSPPPSSSAGVDLHIGFLGLLPLLNLGPLSKKTWRPWICFQNPYENHGSTPKTHLKVLGLRPKSNYLFGSVPLKSWAATEFIIIKFPANFPLCLETLMGSMGHVGHPMDSPYHKSLAKCPRD